MVLTNRRLVDSAVGVLLLLTSACASTTNAEPTEPGAAVRAAETDARADALAALAEEDPAALLTRVRRAAAEDPMRARTTRSEDGDEYSYTFLADEHGWRVETEAAPEDGGDGVASLLATGDQTCFDREFRSRVSGLVASSYGVVEFDPEPWTCTPSRFGLNRMLSFNYTRQDPRWRIESLRVDPTSAPTVEVVDGRPLLRLRTTGTSVDGPLDAARPAYDLWIGADHRPVRLTTAGTRWDFDYPADLGLRLTSPVAGERGSYGYAVGPGQGTAKACQQSGRCPEETLPRQALVWGDGRR